MPHSIVYQTISEVFIMYSKILIQNIGMKIYFFVHLQNVTDLRKPTFNAQAKIFQDGQKHTLPIFVKFYYNILTIAQPPYTLIM